MSSFLEKLIFLSRYLPTMLSYLFMTLSHSFQARIHSLTYRVLPNAKNIVVVGGAFPGVHLATRLASTLPTGYKVVLVERNSHFNYVFNFPRYSVMRGSEEKAFIPYKGVEGVGPKGILELVRGEVTGIEEGKVKLSDGKEVEYEYLAIATGAQQPSPARLASLEKEGGCQELRNMQSKIKKANKVAVIGGGAVGVQLATDIKTFHPDKEVTLIHSRDRLLNHFGEKLHVYVMGALKNLGIKVILGERPKIQKSRSGEIEFKNTESQTFDLIVPCTGQRPNSSILSQIAPQCISHTTGEILVKPTLQLLSDSKDSSSLSNIFALGDVAATGGVKMARAGMYQAETVRSNMVSLIEGKKTLKNYVPNSIENALHLSLGRSKSVVYHDDNLLEEEGKDDLSIAKAWSILRLDLAKDFS